MERGWDSTENRVEGENGSRPENNGPPPNDPKSLEPPNSSEGPSTALRGTSPSLRPVCLPPAARELARSWPASLRADLRRAPGRAWLRDRPTSVRSAGSRTSVGLDRWDRSRGLATNFLKLSMAAL